MATIKISTYNLEEPSQRIPLANSLTEISGLSLYQEKKLVGINDEEGKVFVLDMDSGKTMFKVKFGKSGDYEGLEVIEDEFFCIKSNGTLTRFSINEAHEIVQKAEIKLPFSTKNDIEGLGANLNQRLLLIVSKASSNIDGSQIKGKAIYAFDLETNKLQSNPLFIIQAKELKAKTGSKSFSASGIAYHQQQNCYYLIASAGKRIIKVDPNGRILETEKLNSEMLRQPEGITFDLNGNLYISSEGKGSTGYLLKFDKRP